MQFILYSQLITRAMLSDLKYFAPKSSEEKRIRNIVGNNIHK